ncbi:hypothetical protein [Brevundimonas sp.]|uniref:CC0125/CC1285 family lipoprotein n=1 Tax=Brevundimonas sp. TaxID=1871086 RepID=UPI0024870039|nr:hypothetical protein [Brevundimonas sp.]MDI1281419.1 hypothetical protein [Brevundimonas sp.]
MTRPLPAPLRKAGILACLGAALVLTGCTTPGSIYHPAPAGVQNATGYSEVRLAPDRYRVTFSGNSFTSRDTVEGYLLYRSAELTLQSGYDWFRVIDREVEHQTTRPGTPDPLYSPWYGSSYLYWRPYWRYYGPRNGWRNWYPYGSDPFWATSIDMRTVERFEASAEIVMGRGPLPAGDGHVFSARQVIDRLGPTVSRP